MALPTHGGSGQHDEVIRLLADAPDGLSDGELTRALQPGFTGIRPQTVNQLCRRMVADGTLERVGSRPIRNRLVVASTPVGRPDLGAPSSVDGTRDDDAFAGDDAPDDEGAAEVDAEVDAATVDAPIDAADVLAASARHADGARDSASPAPDGTQPAPSPAGSRLAALRAVAGTGGVVASPAGGVAGGLASAPPRAWRTNGTPPTSSSPPSSPPAAELARPGRAGADTSPPTWDALQGWSRTANVTAAVATWLQSRGATIRAVSGGAGPARDLVVRLDGDDVHVEVTGWPPDGERTHPTTLAGDWFSAAARAAGVRRRTHPRARIVIALPDTRRYRSLAEDRADTLAGVGTEVWFVGPGGAVAPH